MSEVTKNSEIGKIKFQGKNCSYVGDQDYINFVKEVDAWEIVPLKYAVPQGIDVTIQRQEIRFFDPEIMSDPNLSHLELRLMLNICCYYPAEFMDLCTFEGTNGYVIPGLDDTHAVRDMLLSLRDRGYVSF